MLRVPEYYNNVSLALASVLRDIGLNERTISRRKRACLLGENMVTVSYRLIGLNMSVRQFGSRSEGTTTKGLQSDLDVLYCYHDATIIQDWEDWKANHTNLMMIQDDTPPGYCRLQKLFCNVPLPVTEAMYRNVVKIGEDMVVLQNSLLDDAIGQGEFRNGAAMTLHRVGFFDTDRVNAFPFKVLPNRVRTWIQSQMDNGRISRGMKKYMESNPCYVVGVGSKASQHEALEWRISTSHIERCLMFNLNVTQIQCYVMMKLILKSFLAHPYKMLSSFVCKNILLLCIEKTDAREWRSSNLLKLLSFCLQHLKLCVIHKTCPHFLIRENNLLAQKITTVDAQSWLSERVKLVLQCTDVLPLFLENDDVGRRLQTKMNLNNGLTYIFSSAKNIWQDISVDLVGFLAGEVSGCHQCILNHCQHQADVLQSLYQTLVKLHYWKCQFQRLACAPVKHLLYTDVGCTIASAGIQRDYSVSPEALIWFQAGLNSDVASSRLKLASVFYCSGDLNTVAYILGNVEQRYDIRTVLSTCGCYEFPTLYYSAGFRECADRHDVLSLENVAFCVRFPKSEIYCVPEELRYEMFRSTREELLHRDDDGDDHFWKESAAVDSLLYLYFLQYKTYSRMGRHDDKERALVNLFTIVSEKQENFGHRETAWNLLGQCYEQENRLADAFQCYRISLSIRSNDNSARIHVIRLLLRRRNQQGSF